MEIRAHREPWICDSIAVRVAQITTLDTHEIFSIAEPITVRDLTEKDREQPLPATLQLRPAEAQQFMDELWRVGIRPTDGSGSVGQLAATEKHLEDMRRLVFDGLRVEK